MGLLKFQLPTGLPLEFLPELERTYVVGGPETMPYCTQTQLELDQLCLMRDADESGSISVPWRIAKAGQLICHTATLVERDDAYPLQLELARGKVNRLRCQTAEWTFGGLTMQPALQQQIKDATLAFGRAVSRHPDPEAEQHAENALILASEAGDELIRTYVAQVFQVRQQRAAKLDTVLGCRLGSAVPEGEGAEALRQGCNVVSIPFPAHEIAPTEADYQWEARDAVVNWAKEMGFTILGGPLIDFSTARVPEWLWLWEHDRVKMAKVLADYVRAVVDRYRGSIGIWMLNAASNLPGGLALNDEELLWIMMQLIEAVKRSAPSSELVLGLAQPWGDYMALEETTYSPFGFADMLLRSGVHLAAIDIEVVMGVTPRGSYCRDLLDFSRMLDTYSLLGIPLQVTLGYPAETTPDLQGDSELNVGAGYWRAANTPELQADWASEFLALALCKPYVRAVQWAQYSDAQTHQFPHCGLLDATGKARPAFGRLRKLREKFLQ